MGKASNEALLRLMLVCTCYICEILQSSKSFKLLSITKNCCLILILHVSVLRENVIYSYSHLQFSYSVCLFLSLSLGFLKQAFRASGRVQKLKPAIFYSWPESLGGILIFLTIADQGQTHL